MLDASLHLLYPIQNIASKTYTWSNIAYNSWIQLPIVARCETLLWWTAVEELFLSQIYNSRLDPDLHKSVYGTVNLPFLLGFYFLQNFTDAHQQSFAKNKTITKISEFTVGFHAYSIIIWLWAATCDFQQCGILTSVDSDEPVQPPLKLRNSKWRSKREPVPLLSLCSWCLMIVV